MRRFAGRTAAVSAVVAMMGAGVAWAAWTASGTGSGGAQAGHSVELTTVATTTTGALLYPGGNGDVKIKIQNDNPYPVQVNVVIRDGDIVADNAHLLAGCVSHAVTFGVSHIVGWTIPGDASKEFTLAGAAHMGTQSDNACQGALFSIPVLLVGSSNA